MANIVTALVSIGMIIMGAVIVANASLSSASDISSSLGNRIERAGDRMRTELSLVQADIAGSGTDINISIRNAGQMALTEVSKWDAVIQYYDTSGNAGLKILRLTYTTSATPAHGEWTVVGIYLDTAATDPEIYEPGIINPGETMLIRVNITPAIPTSTDNVVTIGVTNGVRLTAPFSR